MPFVTRSTSTPDGPFTVITDDQGVVAAGWTSNADELVQLVHTSLREETNHLLQEVQGTQSASPMQQRASDLADIAVTAVRAYYSGDLGAPCRVPVHQIGSTLRDHAWATLRDVEPGNPISYKEFAERTGSPAAVRAVASACSRNAAALFVPCHRVVRHDGGLGGFRYGVTIKESLLRREASVQSGQRRA